jgi:hypothetical protein
MGFSVLDGFSTKRTPNSIFQNEMEKETIEEEMRSKHKNQ